MVASMTGFASKIVSLTLEDGNKVNLTISIKSLNSRFFETTFKLPYLLTHLETELIKQFKSHLVRGHIYCTIHVANQSALKGSVEPSLHTIAGYMQAVDKIKKEFNLEGSLNLPTLLGLPNVFSIEERELDQTTTANILATIKELIAILTVARKQEGAALAHDLQQRAAIMENEIEQIEQSSVTLLEEQKAKVNKALQEIEADESKAAESRKSALYATLDKMDIHEEIVRFKSHLKSFISQLKSADQEKGKRLDFTLQELGREVNTMAAKCSDAQIGARAIDIKVELEKAREQVQNLI